MVKVTQMYTYEQYASEVLNFLDSIDEEIIDAGHALELMQDCWGINIEMPKEDEPYFDGYMKGIIDEHNEWLREKREEHKSNYVDLDKKNPDFFTRGD